MKKLFIISGLLALPLTACNSSDEEPVNELIDQYNADQAQGSENSTDENNAQYISKSCISNERAENLIEEEDSFVFIDSLAFDNLSNAITAKDDFALSFVYGEATLSTFSVIFLPFSSVTCSYESYELNQCTYAVDDEESHIEVSGSKTGDVLTYTTDTYEKLLNEQSTSITIYEDIFYRTGSITTTDQSGTVTVNWNRSANGTEYFSSSDQKGNLIEYIENSDCSGEMSYARFDEDLGAIDTTINATWRAEGTAAFDYTRCVYDDELAGLKCTSGEL